MKISMLIVEKAPIGQLKAMIEDQVIDSRCTFSTILGIFFAELGIGSKILKTPYALFDSTMQKHLIKVSIYY